MKWLTTVVGANLAVGLAVTLATLVVTTDVHPAPDDYQGDARLFGYPAPYTYVLTSDRSRETMDIQVSCVVSAPFCNYPYPSSRFGLFSFVTDWLVWSVVAFPIVGLCLVLMRRRPAHVPPESAAAGSP